MRKLRKKLPLKMQNPKQTITAKTAVGSIQLTNKLEAPINDVLVGKKLRIRIERLDESRYPLKEPGKPFMNVRLKDLRIIDPDVTVFDRTTISDKEKQPLLKTGEHEKNIISVTETIGPTKLEKPVIETSTLGPAELSTTCTILAPPPIVNRLPKLTGERNVPIFTGEFLEHSRAVASELRMLRNSKTDCEQENSDLEEHVEVITNIVKNLQGETAAWKSSNDAMQVYIDGLREQLSGALSTLAIPSEPGGATVENITKYMSDLQQMANSNSHAPTLKKAKNIIRKLDLDIQ